MQLIKEVPSKDPSSSYTKQRVKFPCDRVTGVPSLPLLHYPPHGTHMGGGKNTKAQMSRYCSSVGRESLPILQTKGIESKKFINMSFISLIPLQEAILAVCGFLFFFVFFFLIIKL